MIPRAPPRLGTAIHQFTWFAPNTEDLKRHYGEIRDYATKYDNGKMPYDFDVAYDIAAIKDAVSAYDDIQRMIDEETAKFITGRRGGRWASGTSLYRQPEALQAKLAIGIDGGNWDRRGSTPSRLLA